MKRRKHELVDENDFISKGKRCGQFRNVGLAPLKILDIGTAVEGDLCYYPDDAVYQVQALGKVFSSVFVLDVYSSVFDA